jgi:hypothetical protein
MPKGQLFIIREGDRSLLISIAETREAPVTVEQAAPQIEQFLFNKRNKEAASAEVKRLRSTAKIEYMNKPAGTAPALPPLARRRRQLLRPRRLRRPPVRRRPSSDNSRRRAASPGSSDLFNLMTQRQGIKMKRLVMWMMSGPGLTRDGRRNGTGNHAGPGRCGQDRSTAART